MHARLGHMNKGKYTSSGTGRYRYGFIGAENDNEFSGKQNSQNHKYRNFDPRLGRYRSVDPLAKGYPWNSPYAYAENRVIDGIDLEGREYANSTSVYSEGVGVAAGVGFGINLALSQGTAFDMIGITSYKAYSVIWPGNQELKEGNKEAKPIIGAEAYVDAGVRFAYDIPTFEKASKAFGLSFSTISFKAGPGGSLEIGDGTFGARLAFGAGGSLKAGPQEKIYESISVTYDEIGVLGYAKKQWSVENQSPIKNDEGEITGYKGQLYVFGIPTDIIVGSAARKIEEKKDDGSTEVKFESTGNWKSVEYSKAEKKL